MPVFGSSTIGLWANDLNVTHIRLDKSVHNSSFKSGVDVFIETLSGDSMHVRDQLPDKAKAIIV